MSRANTPKDNAVAERFMRTFKEHKINNKIFQEDIFYQVEINSQFRGYRKVFSKYVKSINFKPNTKSNLKSPEQHDLQSSTALMFMVEPKYSKSFSEHYGTDFRRDSINQYKSESSTVISILDELEAKKTKIVDKTPFDLYEDNLVLAVIDERLQAIYSLIQANPETTRQYVEEAILPMQDMLEAMDDKLNQLLPKPKHRKKTLPLRDPVYNELFDVFRAAAGSQAKYKQDLRCAQLQIAYTILFYVGLRVNEIKFFQLKDIQDAISTS